MAADKIEIVFRTNGNSKVGMGHLIRCLALALELQKRSDCRISFLIGRAAKSASKISECGYRIKYHLANGFADVIITSLPQIGLSYCRQLKEKAGLLVCLDDSEARRFSADIVVRGSVVPQLRDCDSGNRAKLLLGPDFMVLNRDFQKFNRKNKKIKSKVRSILITMGGSDVNNLTPKVMCALRGLKDIKKTVIAGPVFKSIGRLKGAGDYILKYDVSNMAELMFSSDLIISGGGMSLYELACVGAPGIVLCQTNYQLLEANCFQKKGAVINLGPGRHVSEGAITSSVDDLLNKPKKRKMMSLAGKKLVDGRAAGRVAMEILRRI